MLKAATAALAARMSTSRLPTPSCNTPQRMATAGATMTNAGEGEAGRHGHVGPAGHRGHRPSRARRTNWSASEPSGRTHRTVSRSPTTSTWRNWSVRSATAVNAPSHLRGLAPTPADHVRHPVLRHDPLVVVVVAGEHEVDSAAGEEGGQALAAPGVLPCTPDEYGGWCNATTFHWLSEAARASSSQVSWSRRWRRTRRGSWSRGRRSPPGRASWCSTAPACRAAPAPPRWRRSCRR